MSIKKYMKVIHSKIPQTFFFYFSFLSGTIDLVRFICLKTVGYYVIQLQFYFIFPPRDLNCNIKILVSYH